MRQGLYVVVFLLGTAVVRAAPIAKPVAASVVAQPLAEKDGLKISISNHVNFDSIYSSRPHVDIVLQNTSAQTQFLISEFNSWGITDLSLEITSVNGKVLDKPLIVERSGRMMFAENFLSSETIEPGECIVREVNLFTPGDDENAGQSMWLYRNFPWKAENDPQQVTMRAVYSNDEPLSSSRAIPSHKNAWTGKIASPLKQFNFYWNRN